MTNQAPIIECIPNFSEGRNPEKIAAISESIASVPGVKLLHVDPGYDAHRTVMTFAGGPEQVAEAAFRGVARAAELIDMRHHQGTHPRMGATDVCPLVPVRGIGIAQTAELARQLARRVGTELGIPVFCYEASAFAPERRSLAWIRAGEYEGQAARLQQADYQPDFGPAQFRPETGATVIGAREFLLAYNINLNTTDVEKAKQIAGMVRESGVIRNGERVPGLLPGVRAIGWYLPAYGCAQVSMNLTRLRITPVHKAFEAVCHAARQVGVEVTGSELIGLTPEWVLTEAGQYFAAGQNLNNEGLIDLAVETLGLAQFSPFQPEARILEWAGGW